ncbi:MAG: AAA-like domain-containing protein [Phormidium sp.]
MNAQTFQQHLQALKAESPKTYELLREFLGNGGDFQQTAETQGIKEGTARKHLSNVYEKFEIEGSKQKKQRLVALFSQYQPDWVNPEQRLNRVERLTGIVPLNSPFYIERSEDETIKQAFRSCQNDERLVFCRLRSARGLGKSSLLVRLQNFLEKELHHHVGWVDLAAGTLGNLDDFPSLIKFFTRSVAREFAPALPAQHQPLADLQEHWREELAPGINCMDYLEQQVFKPINALASPQPLTLIIDGIDSLLGQRAVQGPFLDWLRSWNERKMKRVSQEPVVWSNVVIAYSTDPYAAYEMAGSPLDNVGLPIELREFEPPQVKRLIQLYGLTWHNNKEQVQQLMDWIGGHPELLNRSLYAMRTENRTLEDFLKSATQPGSEFNTYLQEYLRVIQEHPSLKSCLMNILNGKPAQDEFAIFQLDKCGLIDVHGSDNKPRPRFKLYEEYFKRALTANTES